MEINSGPGAAPNARQVTDSKPLVERAKDIMLQPQEEWRRIDAEPATIGGIYTSYVVILAAIPAVAMALGYLLFGFGFVGSWTMRVIVGAVVYYLLTLGSVYVMALIIDALAPTFNSQKNQLNAFKVAAYSSTPAWVAGVLMIVPALAPIAMIGGLYGLYLLYLGLPALMRTPQDKAVPYVVVTIVAAIIVFAVVGQVASRMMWGGLFF